MSKRPSSNLLSNLGISSDSNGNSKVVSPGTSPKIGSKSKSPSLKETTAPRSPGIKNFLSLPTSSSNSKGGTKTFSTQSESNHGSSHGRAPSVSSINSILSDSSSSISISLSPTPSSLVPQEIPVSEAFLEYLKFNEKSCGTPLILDIKKLNKLQRACYDGDVKKVRALLLEKNRDVNKFDTIHGVTPLHICAAFNQLECAKQLFQPPTPTSSLVNLMSFSTKPQSGFESRKVDMTLVDRKGRTPLVLVINLSICDPFTNPKSFK